MIVTASQLLFLSDHRFRWVSCQLEALRDTIPGTIEHTLNKLPRTLEETYERILRGIGEGNQKYALCLLQCLYASIRPLRVVELADVLAILFDNEGVRIDWRSEGAQQALLSACSSFITVTNLDGHPVVQFAHFTVRGFLTSNHLAHSEEHLRRYHILPLSAHTTLARACLGVLLSFDGQVDKSVVENRPLSLYAAQHWVSHAKFEGVSSGVQDLMERLFDKDKPYLATWVWIHDFDRPWQGQMSTMHPTQPFASPLYYAALYGLCSVVECLAVKHPGDVTTDCGSHGNPFHAACAKREIDTALILLQHGADINALDNSRRSALRRASENGRVDVVKFLLEQQADVNVQDDEGASPLHRAAMSGFREACRLLLMHGANAESQDFVEGTPLHTASWNGHCDIVEELCVHGANANARDNQLWTPLHLASMQGHLEIVKSLVCRRSAGITNTNEDGETPLDVASRFGRLEIARFLVEQGADSMTKDKDGQTLLHSASRHGDTGFVEALLKTGMDVDVRSTDKETPLVIASAHGKLDVARFLLERGADIDC